LACGKYGGVASPRLDAASLASTSANGVHRDCADNPASAMKKKQSSQTCRLQLRVSVER
jgi:hypothetical protein